MIIKELEQQKLRFRLESKSVLLVIWEVIVKVKDLPLIISISGDQFKEKENMPEELIINDESNLYMIFVLCS